MPESATPEDRTVPVEILSRWDRTKVLFRAEVDAAIPLFGRIKAAVQVAVGSGANLRGANLRGADLGGADLGDANLRAIRNDLWDVLLRAIPEVAGLQKALRDGRVDGSTYTGECACLVGTIANIRGVDHRTIDYRDPSRPIEVFFASIRKGDAPGNSQPAQIVDGWISEFQAFIAPPVASPAR